MEKKIKEAKESFANQSSSLALVEPFRQSSTPPSADLTMEVFLASFALYGRVIDCPGN